MVADTLVYSNRDGTPDPAVDPYRKIFSWGDRVVIGSSGMLKERQQWDTGFNDKGRPVSTLFEYEFNNWISSVYAHRRDSDTSPAEIAAYVLSNAREAFQRAESIAKAGRWSCDSPSNPIVIYVVAGFSEKFSEFGIHECRVNFNSEGNGFEYIAPAYHPDEIWLTGQVEHIQAARSKKEPESSLLRRFRDECIAQVKDVLPNADLEVIERVAFAVGCVRVQSNFTPDTVGNSVTIMIVDRESKGVVMGTL
jgi:hypothetical protein